MLCLLTGNLNNPRMVEICYKALLWTVEHQFIIQKTKNLFRKRTIVPTTAADSALIGNGKIALAFTIA